MIKICKLKNKTIIITGGTGLIGSGFSKECAEHGAIVVIADVDEKKENRLTEQIEKETGNNKIFFQKCDITNLTSISDSIDIILNKFRKIDVLVNNAYPRNKNYGIKFEEVTYEDFCENINMHLGGYFLTIQRVAKIMIKKI